MEDVQPGSNQYIAGYKGKDTKKTTLGNNVSISVLGDTDQTNSTAYGSDNAHGVLEAGDNLAVTVNAKGYINSFGLSTIGNDASHKSSTTVGDNLTVNVTATERPMVFITAMGTVTLIRLSAKMQLSLSMAQQQRPFLP